MEGMFLRRNVMVAGLDVNLGLTLSVRPSKTIGSDLFKHALVDKRLTTEAVVIILIYQDNTVGVLFQNPPNGGNQLRLVKGISGFQGDWLPVVTLVVIPFDYCKWQLSHLY
jgi:hypothetical protein